MIVNKRITIESIISRIKHDRVWGGPEDWCIGYEDRFLGIIEKPYIEFTRESASDPNSVDGIPLHRIQYFKCLTTGKYLTRKNKFYEAFEM